MSKCKECGAYCLSGSTCYGCHELETESGEADHDSRVRCPKCLHVSSISDQDDYDLYGEGPHEVSCSECGADFEIVTNVSYSFTSPAKEGR